MYIFLSDKKYLLSLKKKLNLVNVYIVYIYCYKSLALCLLSLFTAFLDRKTEDNCSIID